MQINYYSDRAELMPPIRRQIVNRWIRLVIDEMNQELGELNFQYVNDEEILATNRQYLDHDYYTDVITFPGASESEDDTSLYGDIMISIDTVATNAKELGLPIDQELYRVMIHGVLHLLGIDDKTDEQAQLMRMAEDRALGQLAEMLEGRPYFRVEGANKFFTYIKGVQDAYIPS